MSANLFAGLGQILVLSFLLSRGFRNCRDERRFVRDGPELRAELESSCVSPLSGSDDAGRSA
jgi:hypothetical protein